MLKISVPASTSNLGAGFDAFGLALNLYNEFYIEPSDHYEILVEGEGSESLPRDEKNLFIRVYKRACSFFGVKEIPVRLRQVNRIPTARGLGSSATAILGGIQTCLSLNSLEVNPEEILKLAFEFEPHPDNLVPALLGGFIVCASSEEGIKYLTLDFPHELKVVVCVPEFELSTQKARQVLKREVPLRDAVFNLQRSALMVGALLTKRFDLLREAVKDRIHQPYRAELIPGFWQVLKSAYEEGALAVFLSGAGPTVASLCLEGEERIGRAMVQAFKEHGIGASWKALEVSRQGLSVK